MCPECGGFITYPTDTSMLCAACGHEWNPEEVAAANAGPVVKDANGNVLKDGDDVVVVKDLPVKGMPKPVKAGTKVRGIGLVQGDHDIDRRIEGSGCHGPQEHLRAQGLIRHLLCSFSSDRREGGVDGVGVLEGKVTCVLRIERLSPKMLLEASERCFATRRGTGAEHGRALCEAFCNEAWARKTLAQRAVAEAMAQAT